MCARRVARRRAQQRRRFLLIRTSSPSATTAMGLCWVANWTAPAVWPSCRALLGGSGPRLVVRCVRCALWWFPHRGRECCWGGRCAICLPLCVGGWVAEGFGLRGVSVRGARAGVVRTTEAMFSRQRRRELVPPHTKRGLGCRHFLQKWQRVLCVLFVCVRGGHQLRVWGAGDRRQAAVFLRGAGRAGCWSPKRRAALCGKEENRRVAFKKTKSGAPSSTPGF